MKEPESGMPVQKLMSPTSKTVTSLHVTTKKLRNSVIFVNNKDCYLDSSAG